MSDETSAAIAERKAHSMLVQLFRAFELKRIPRHLPDCPVILGYDDMADWFLEKFPRAAASSDLDAIKREAAREAAREALTKLAQLCYDRQMPGDGTENYVADHIDIRAFRDREYPAPVPEPPHVMVNGWRVTWNGTGYVAENPDRTIARQYFAQAVTLCERLSVGLEEDTDVVRVLALREGRGDQ